MYEVASKLLIELFEEMSKKYSHEENIPISELAEIINNLSETDKQNILMDTDSDNIYNAIDKLQLVEYDPKTPYFKINKLSLDSKKQTTILDLLDSIKKKRTDTKTETKPDIKTDTSKNPTIMSTKPEIKEPQDNKMYIRIKKLINHLKEGLVEKDEAIRLAFLSSIAGESIFLLGLPGTAKSMVSRRLKAAFKGSDNKDLHYFEYLMNQFSTPDELFGPVSLKKLEEDVYERVVDGFLPNAEIAFLDEIWKASPAIQNTLLTIINEKKFHNGKSVLKVPLVGLISASNELPAQNQGLEALWDRFLIRLSVKPVLDNNSFLDLVCGKTISADIEESENAISISEITEWQKQIEKITIPDEVRDVIDAIHHKMWSLHSEHPEDNTYYISDRRWMKIVHILKTAAFLNGRSSVDLMDCHLISYCIWNNYDVVREITKLTEDSIISGGEDFTETIEKTEKKLNDFDSFVTDSFFVDSERKPQLSKMKDGTMAYQLVTPIKVSNKTIQYIATITKIKTDSWDSIFFTDNKECTNDIRLRDSNNVKFEKDTISFDYYNYGYHSHTSKIVMKPTEKVKSPELFGYVQQRTPITHRMNDGKTAYQITTPRKIKRDYYGNQPFKPFYIVPPSNNDYGHYYDDDKDIISSMEIRKEYYSISDNSITINDHYYTKEVFIIEMKDEKFVKGDTKTLNSLKASAQSKYKKIQDEISNQISKIDHLITEEVERYSNNLFADTSFCETILKEAINAKGLFEIQAEKLEKIKFRYSSLKSDK